MARSKQETAPIEVEFDSDVLRRIRQHTRTSMSAEVCGVLIGSERRDGVVVEAAIAGENAGQGSAHVTFTQETWEHIYKIKDEKYPDARIVGWYHSHPGFGVFLSDHDTFIHEKLLLVAQADRLGARPPQRRRGMLRLAQRQDPAVATDLDRRFGR